jgi:hypothetical protein
MEEGVDPVVFISIFRKLFKYKTIKNEEENSCAGDFDFCMYV